MSLQNKSVWCCYVHKALWFTISWLIIFTQLDIMCCYRRYITNIWYQVSTWFIALWFIRNLKKLCVLLLKRKKDLEIILHLSRYDEIIFHLFQSTNSTGISRIFNICDNHLSPNVSIWYHTSIFSYLLIHNKTWHFWK